MGRHGPRHLLILRNVTERLIEGVHRGEHVSRHPAAHGHMQMQLVHRLNVGQLQKQALAVGEHRGRADGKRVVPHCAVVTRRELGRAV